MKNQLSLILQYLLPQHALSRLVGLLANTTYPPIKNTLIRLFIKRFNINLDDAISSDINHYPTFNAFFTRKLKENARPYPKNKHTITSPVDGTISQIGDITSGNIIQAKGHQYSLYTLLGGETDHATHLKSGKFATIYLSPADYHRVHMPTDGQLTGMTHVPGRLFSVNTYTSEHVPQLFARNERVVLFFDTQHGPLALVMVGAMLVASIVTTFSGLITPPTRRHMHHVDFSQTPKSFRRGDELGWFQFGSTVILAGELKWREHLIPRTPLQLGEAMANSH